MCSNYLRGLECNRAVEKFTFQCALEINGNYGRHALHRSITSFMPSKCDYPLINPFNPGLFPISDTPPLLLVEQQRHHVTGRGVADSLCACAGGGFGSLLGHL